MNKSSIPDGCFCVKIRHAAILWTLDHIQAIDFKSLHHDYHQQQSEAIIHRYRMSANKMRARMRIQNESAKQEQVREQEQEQTK